MGIGNLRSFLLVILMKLIIYICSSALKSQSFEKSVWQLDFGINGYLHKLDVRHCNQLHFCLSLKRLAMDDPVKHSWCRRSDCCINCLSHSSTRSPSVHWKIRQSNSFVLHWSTAHHKVTQAEPMGLKWGLRSVGLMEWLTVQVSRQLQ